MPIPDPADGPPLEEFVVRDDWHPSGWGHVLPRHQAGALATLYATAAHEGMTGTIDDVFRTLIARAPRAFESMPDGLDSPVMWLEPEDLDGVDTSEEEARVRAWVAEFQAASTDVLVAAGLEVPATARELAEVMVALGLASQADGVWAMPKVLPLPEEVLPLARTRNAGLARLRAMQGRLS
ncbi:DUF6042 family protein [Streptomyces sp. NPDC006551]|uniref:DUF6042 family protein n=1 Tax=Streptomyces sp. NPDC006551 TaxID=3157178 RepID=UPI0033BA9192